MKRANGGAGPGTLPERQWDVALSFAGAQRDYVGQVAEALKARGVRCFYDADEEIELWGRYLADELPAIYGEQAAAVVMFVSAEYAAREWTRLERRAALARAVRERREYVLPARFDDTALPGLPSDMVTVDLRTRTPQQFAAMIAGKLAALAAASAALADAGGRSGRPAGAVRVSEADPRRLGVHAAISMPGVPDEALPEYVPEYVPRDVDAAGSGVWAKVTAAGEQGGFLLLVGGSSVGKTRSAVEAVKALLPDWWLVHPAGPAGVAALAAEPPPRTVVWLDELQRYLDGEHGLTGGVVRALLNASHPAVIIGTMWPDFYAAYTTVPTPGGADPHSREREVLDLAVVVRIGPAFSPAEQGRARAAATRDPRLRVALEAAGYGLTQTLAAAPQLVARWEDARTASPYGWAVLTAALDAARLGARAPLSVDLLRAAAPGYCTSQQQAEAPENWFEQALAYATAKLHGAVAALSPAGAAMGQVAGYTLADFLIQHASRERRKVRVPGSTWDAVLTYVRDPADIVRLADSARNRLLYRYAIPLYRHAAADANAGDEYAAGQLARLLAERGDLDGLRARADAGDRRAASQLYDVLAERGDLDGAAQILCARADAVDRRAAARLVGLLVERGDLDKAARALQAGADAGDEGAASRLAQMLAERGDLGRLRARADAGDLAAAGQLAAILAERGDLDELRARADVRRRTRRRRRPDKAAAFYLAKILAERGDLDGAARALQAWADAGDWYAAQQLAAILAERGDLGGLRARADAGDWHAAGRLAAVLYERGDLDGLRARADAGDMVAASLLPWMLAERGDLDGAVQVLRALAEADMGAYSELFDVNTRAFSEVAWMLAERGDLDGAAQLLQAGVEAGDEGAALQLAGLLARRGDLDGLRARADAGDEHAVWHLYELLAERGDLDGAEQLLRAWADAGNSGAALRLAGLLVKRGDLDGLRARADAGDGYAASDLAGLLARRGDLDGLRARADAGDWHAASELAGLLARRGDLDGAARVLQTWADDGDGYAAYQLARQLAGILAERGDLDGLRARADAGDEHAAQQLPELLIKQGRGEEAERLHRFGLNPDGSIAWE